MKARWIAGGLEAGLVLGTITVTGAPRSGIKPTATDSSGSYIDISCPP